jgi:hypothetical protein
MLMLLLMLLLMLPVLRRAKDIVLLGAALVSVAGSGSFPGTLVRTGENQIGLVMDERAPPQWRVDGNRKHTLHLLDPSNSGSRCLYLCFTGGRVWGLTIQVLLLKPLPVETSLSFVRWRAG